MQLDQPWAGGCAGPPCSTRPMPRAASADAASEVAPSNACGSSWLGVGNAGGCGALPMWAPSTRREVSLSCPPSRNAPRYSRALECTDRTSSASRALQQARRLETCSSVSCGASRSRRTRRGDSADPRARGSRASAAAQRLVHAHSRMVSLRRNGDEVGTGRTTTDVADRASVMIGSDDSGDRASKSVSDGRRRRQPCTASIHAAKELEEQAKIQLSFQAASRRGVGIATKGPVP